jgi:predicted permease
MFSEIRFAARALVKNPAFSLTAIAVLALGIGANGAIFGLVSQALFAPPGIADPDRVVAVRARYGKLNLPSISLSAPDFDDVRRATEVFEHAAVMEPRSLNYTGGDTPQLVEGAAVSLHWFDVFGARPALGRTFVADEDQPDANFAVILSDAGWVRLFGRDPGIVGRTVLLNAKPHKVVGVMRPGFRWPREVDVWVPLGLPPVELTPDYRFNEHLLAVARTKPGMTLAEADARVRTIADRVRGARDENGAFARDSVWGMFAMPFTHYVAGQTRRPMLVLLGAVAFVLLIACANIAGLMLARSASRAREIAVRAALGARRGQLVRQTIVESLLLAAAGAVLGLAIAYAGMRLLLVIAPEGAVVGLAATVNASVVLFTGVAGLVAGLLFALAPAWQVSRVAPFDAIKGGGRTSSAGPGRQRIRAALVVAETALAVVLLVGAGLLIRSLARLQEVSPGFDPRGVVTGGVGLPDTQYRNLQQRIAFFRALIDRLSSTPGVLAAGAAVPLPFVGGDSTASFQIEGRTLGPGDPGPHGRNRFVTPGYFATMRIPLERGRVFTDDDRLGGEMVAVIDENLARTYWPSEDPVGRRMRLGQNGPWLRIVGIVGHVTHGDLAGESDKGTYYRSMWQQAMPGAMVVARMRPGVAARPAIIADAVRSIDPSLPVQRMATLADRVAASLAPRRFVMRVLAFFASVALLMAALGLYGVISYSVTQRTQELGIRMALGAGRPSVVRLVLGQGLRLAILGMVIGVGGAFAASRLIASQLYDVSPFDPLTFGAMIAVLLATALLASYLPARAASRVDPLVALRYE